MVVFAVGVSRLDWLFGSHDEPKDSASWLKGQEMWGVSYCGARSVKVTIQIKSSKLANKLALLSSADKMLDLYICTALIPFRR